MKRKTNFGWRLIISLMASAISFFCSFFVSHFYFAIPKQNYIELLQTAKADKGRLYNIAGYRETLPIAWKDLAYEQFLLVPLVWSTDDELPFPANLHGQGRDKEVLEYSGQQKLLKISVYRSDCSFYFTSSIGKSLQFPVALYSKK